MTLNLRILNIKLILV